MRLLKANLRNVSLLLRKFLADEKRPSLDRGGERLLFEKFPVPQRRKLVEQQQRQPVGHRCRNHQDGYHQKYDHDRNSDDVQPYSVNTLS